jgi:uncharacterized hydrophobic protein (TIGR00271 family)
VIGAMIVAPLMGPILGLAMGIVVGDTQMFRRSLTAEATGVVLVIMVGLLVAQMVGIEQIDFSASEIANRTKPTLYDLAIGFAAGLAGAFCMLHPGLQASVAGVAIAVALVPPLAVTGVTAAGWLHGELSWRPAFGSFMLFFANYLTIELAACVLFYSCGFHVQRQQRPASSFRRAIGINLLLLIATAVFLSQQLSSLVRERIGLVTARQVLKEGLSDIPGADLDSLDVTLDGPTLIVKAVVGSRRDIPPSTVALLERQLSKSLEQRLPRTQPRLVIRTVSSVYVSRDGYLFEPEGTKLSPARQRLQDIEVALREELKVYPEVELDSFRAIPQSQADLLDSDPAAWNFEVTLRAPFEFTPDLVDELETRVNDTLDQKASATSSTLRLLVRTVIVKSATARDRISIVSPDPAQQAENPALRQLLQNELEDGGRFEVLQLLIRRRRPVITAATQSLKDALTSEAYEIHGEVRGREFLNRAALSRIQTNVERAYRESHGKPVELSLRIVTVLSDTVTTPD